MISRVLQSRPNPTSSYPESLNRFEAILQSLPIEQLYTPSLPFLLTHGQKTKRVIVWFHGYTNSPHGFEQIARACFDQGDNVYVPLAPYHGYRDRLTTDTGLITAEKLADFANKSLDIAAGLGDELIVGGLSMGGVITGWLAQKRPNIRRAIIISPAFGANTIPARATDLMSFLMLLRRDKFRWWNPGDEKKDYTQLSSRSHTYPRISLHGLAQIFRLGASARLAGFFHPPLAQETWWVLNDNDVSISNDINRIMYRCWHRQAPDRVHCYTFPASLKLGHDIIDPSSATQKVNLSHPVLLKILNGQSPNQ